MLSSVREYWVSLFTDRAILYRLENGFGDLDLALSVLVEQMVEPEVSGIMFTADPVSGRRDTVSIEDASFGLGEALVSGLVQADLYQIDKHSHKLIAKKIAEKRLMIRSPLGGSVVQMALTSSECNEPSLSEVAAQKLARLGIEIEGHYQKPLGIEWALKRAHRLRAATSHLTVAAAPRRTPE